MRKERGERESGCERTREQGKTERERESKANSVIFFGFVRVISQYLQFYSFDDHFLFSVQSYKLGPKDDIKAKAKKGKKGKKGGGKKGKVRVDIIVLSYYSILCDKINVTVVAIIVTFYYMYMQVYVCLCFNARHSDTMLIVQIFLV